MAVDRGVARVDEGLRALSRNEIERRIERVLFEVTSADGLFDEAEDRDPMRPRWISTAEFVRRMRPFMVYN